jgi:CO/xanthine dehydrogenase FAD-binding subunit
MKPPPFDYHAPDQLSEVLDLLSDYGDDAKIIAGGQSLMPLLAFRLARPHALIDVAGVDCLHHLDLAADEVVLGATIRHREVERLDDSQLPAAIHEAISHIGHPAIRNRGTVGGSVAHADPRAEWAGLSLAFDGTIVARSNRGARTIAAEEFFLDFLTSALEPDEIVTEVRLRRPSADSGSAFVEFARRHGDFAIGGVCAVIRLTGNAVVEDARVAVIGTGNLPTRCHATERTLVNETFGDDVMDAAIAELHNDLEVWGVDKFEQAYRLQVGREFARRAIMTAAGRAKNGLVGRG